MHVYNIYIYIYVSAGMLIWFDVVCIVLRLHNEMQHSRRCLTREPGAGATNLEHLERACRGQDKPWLKQPFRCPFVSPSVQQLAVTCQDLRVSFRMLSLLSQISERAASTS